MASTGPRPASFGGIPREIQDKIWNIVASVPRVITLHHFPDQSGKIGLKSKTPLATIFQVDSVSRRQGLLCYEPLFPTGETTTRLGVFNKNGFNTYFSRSRIDTLYLPSTVSGRDEVVERNECLAAMCGIFELGQQTLESSPFKYFAIDFCHLSLGPDGYSMGRFCDGQVFDTIANEELASKVEGVVFVVNERQDHPILERRRCGKFSTPMIVKVQMHVALAEVGAGEQYLTPDWLWGPPERDKDWSSSDDQWQQLSRAGQNQAPVLLGKVPQDILFCGSIDCKAKVLKVRTSTATGELQGLVSDPIDPTWCRAVCCGREVVVTARIVACGSALRLSIPVSLEGYWAGVESDVVMHSDLGVLPSLSLGVWV